MYLTTDSEDEDKEENRGLKEKIKKVKRILKPWVIGQKLKEVFHRIFKKKRPNSANNSEGEYFSDFEDEIENDG